MYTCVRTAENIVRKTSVRRCVCSVQVARNKGQNEGKRSVFSPLTIPKSSFRGEKRNDVGDANTGEFTRRNRKFHRQVLTMSLPLRLNVRELSRTINTGEKLPIIINITEVLLYPDRWVCMCTYATGSYSIVSYDSIILFPVYPKCVFRTVEEEKKKRGKERSKM